MRAAACVRDLVRAITVVLAVAGCGVSPVASPEPAGLPSASLRAETRTPSPSPSMAPATRTAPPPSPPPSPTSAPLPDLAVLVGSWVAGDRSGFAIVIHSERQARLDGTIASTLGDGPLPCARSATAVGISAVRSAAGTFELGPYSSGHSIDADEHARWSLELDGVDATSASGSFRIVRGACDSGPVPWSATFTGTGADALGTLPIDARELRRVGDLLRCWATAGCTD